jgi:IS30 family transposase
LEGVVGVGRPRSRRSLEREFWEQVRVRVSWEEAAAAVGVSTRVAWRWVVESGGVKPRLVEPTRSLSYLERCRIEALHAAGHSRAEIARRLGRHRSTIGRELDRNGTRRIRRGGYSAVNGQSKADQRARRPKPAKLATHLVLRREVQDRLKAKHSPEQIARRLREEFPEDPEMWVSHETIYQSLYVQARGGLSRELTRHLRTGRTLRKPRRQADQRRERFAGMVMISERPAEVEDRAVPGHWEGDLILGSTESGSAVGTLVERMTRFVMLLHLPGGHTAEIVQEAMVAKMAALPEQLRLSLTWDQGSELANHVQIAEATGLSIYFCDPHSPWQRGSNENTNGLLRQYLPKGKDLSFYGPGTLDNIAAELNARPRKTLNWRTPAEALDALLSGQSDPPVATTG